MHGIIKNVYSTFNTFVASLRLFQKTKFIDLKIDNMDKEKTKQYKFPINPNYVLTRVFFCLSVVQFFLR